ncbi:MAG: replication-associated recombination protein A [Clostridia bacterium]
MYKPLADILRPQELNDVVGQTHILGENGILRRVIERGNITNMIFYGPSGVGKTTVARIIARKTKRKFAHLNATTASISDIKEIIDQLDTFLAPDGVLLYLDEIQYFNKKQQQSLLEFIENGKITLIASTTENPYFYVYNAILSRSVIYEFQPVSSDEIAKAVKKALKDTNATEKDISYISNSSMGDVRRAINTCEALINSSKINGDKYEIDFTDVLSLTGNSGMRYDKNGDEHYNTLSAFQKSIRGSDPDAAIHYLARLIKAGDLKSICRRLLVISAEDIGLAYPQAIAITKACVDTALMVGFPEAKIPLAEAVILLATAPKSNSANNAINIALADIDSGNVGDIPAHLKDGHYAGSKKLGHSVGYKFPHDYKNHYVSQDYLPSEINNRIYYEFGENKVENASKLYWSKIKDE